MIKIIMLLALCVAAIYCLIRICTILRGRLPVRKDMSMDKETKKTLWISGLLFAANALGIAYLLNPGKFEEKKNQLRDAIKTFFTSAK